MLKFVYSYPYEQTLLLLAGKKPTKEHDELGQKKAEVAQKIWDKYEKKILKLFASMYKIEIPEEFIKAWISLVLPRSFSNPLTVSLLRFSDIEDNPRSQRALVYVTIHELAHFFSYTRPKTAYFNKLFASILKKDLLGHHGANLHYLVQAVEFGIIGEVFGKRYAEYKIKRVSKKRAESEYGKSAKLLAKHSVPLDKTCLEYIEKDILRG